MTGPITDGPAPDQQPIAQSHAGEPIACPKCGVPHDLRRCQAHVDPAKREAYAEGGREARAAAKGPVRQCLAWPVAGLEVCVAHGGMAGHAFTAGMRNFQIQQIQRAAQTYGVPREVGPVQALVELLRDSAGHVVWLREIVQASDPDALVWGKSDEVNRQSGEFPGVDTKYAAAPSVWLAQYERERRFLLEVSRELARLGLEWDAREAIRKQGAALAAVVRATVRRLGLDPTSPEVIAAYRGGLKDVLGPGVDVGRVVDGHLA
jgi:hypothetical protein